MIYLFKLVCPSILMLVYQRVNPLQPPLIDDFPWFFPLQTSMYRLCSMCFPLKPPFIHDFPTNTSIYRWFSLIFPTKTSIYRWGFYVVQIRSTESQEFARNASKESRKYLEVGRSGVFGSRMVRWNWEKTWKTLGNPWKIHVLFTYEHHLSIIF